MSRYAVAVVVVVAALIGAAFAPGGVAVVATLLIGALALSIGWRLSRPPSTGDRRFVLGWTAGSVGLHLVLGLVIAAVPSAVNYLDKDAIGYDSQAFKLARHWTAGAARPHLSPGKSGFVKVLAALYTMFGHHLSAGIAFNALCAGALVMIIADTTRRIGGDAAGRLGAAISALFPGFVLWPSLLLREATVLLLLAVIANTALRLVERFTIWRCAVIGACVAALFSNRTTVAAVIVIALIIGEVVGRRRLATSVAAVLVTAIFASVFIFGLGVGRDGVDYVLGQHLSSVASLRDGLESTSNSGAGIHSDLSSVAGIAKFLPLGTLDASFGPFPWQLQSRDEAPGMLDGIVMILVAFGALRGLLLAFRRERWRVAVLVTPALLLLGMVTLIGGNYGFIVRERTQVVVMVIPFLALGLADMWHRSIDDGDLRSSFRRLRAGSRKDQLSPGVGAARMGALRDGDGQLPADTKTPSGRDAP